SVSFGLLGSWATTAGDQGRKQRTAEAAEYLSGDGWHLIELAGLEDAVYLVESLGQSAFDSRPHLARSLARLILAEPSATSQQVVTAAELLLDAVAAGETSADVASIARRLALISSAD